MLKRKIANCEKKLPSLIIGTSHPSIHGALLPGAADTAEEDMFRLLDELWDLGLNMYDCAAVYGEEAIGRYLSVRKRYQDAVIVSKCAHPNAWRNRVTSYDMESDLHDSLAKLKTDHIDIYLLHRDDPDVPVSEIMETLYRFHRQGKIGAIGASNWTIARMQEANDFAKENNLLPFTACSPNYGLAHQVKDLWGWGSTTLTGPEHEADRQWCKIEQMPVFAYSSMARGFFSGKFRSNEPEKAEEILDDFAKVGYYYPENMERLRRAEILAEKYDCPVSVIAIGYMFHQGLDVFPIMSGSKVKHFTQALDAMKLPLTKQEVRWLDLLA